MTTVASSILNRNNDSVFFIIEKSLVDFHNFWIGCFRKKIAVSFEIASFLVDESDALFDLIFKGDTACL